MSPMSFAPDRHCTNVRALCVKLSLLCLLLGMISVAGRVQAQKYRHKRTIGGYGVGVVHQPRDMTVDSAGNVYVADTGGNRVQKFDRNGNYLMSFGSYGTGDGEFSSSFPGQIAVDASGNIYVVDNQRVQKFDSKGDFLLSIGAGGQFSGSLALDQSGNIIITDSGQNLVLKYAPNGQLLASFGSTGSGNGQMLQPVAIAVDGSGNYYVIDDGNKRIQKFDSNGNYLLQFGIVAGVRGVTVDASGNIYVAEPFINRIEKFDSSGRFLLTIGTYGSNNGQIDGPMSVKAFGGLIYVADTNNNRIQIFDESANYLAQMGNRPTANGQMYHCTDVKLDGQGNIYVLDAGNNRVQKFAPRGQFVLAFGSQGTGDGQFSSPIDLAVDRVGHVYVLESTRVQKLDSNGNLLLKFGSSGTGNGQFTQAVSLALDAAGNVYVNDNQQSLNNGVQQGRIEKFDSNGNYLNQFGVSSNGSVALDRFGNILIGSFRHVDRYDANGNWLGSFGSSDPGKLVYIYDISLDGSGNTYVLQPATLERFDPNGNFNFTLLDYDQSSASQMFLQSPNGMTNAPNGDLYIADTGDSRVEVFSPVRFDLNLDGNTDLLWHNAKTGDATVWYMNGTQWTKSWDYVAHNAPTNLALVAACDLLNNGNDELLWRDQTTGDLLYWQLNGHLQTGQPGYIHHQVPLEWSLVGVADMNGDGQPDLIWHNAKTGDVTVWYMNGTQWTGKWDYIAKGVPTQWKLVGTADFKGDGYSDLLWRNTQTGDVTVWYMKGAVWTHQWDYIARGVPTDWNVVAILNDNGVNEPDLVWQNTRTGDVVVWYMNGAVWTHQWDYIARGVPTDWRIVQTY